MDQMEINVDETPTVNMQENTERETHVKTLRKNNTKFYHPFHIHSGSSHVDKLFAEIDLDVYTELNSMIFSYCSEPIIEFENLKPVKSIVYKMLVCIANKNFPSDNPFILDADAEGNLTKGKTLYWPDFYKVHPCALKEMSCEDGHCNVEHNIASKFWCKKCQKTLLSIKSITKNLVANVIDFNKIPPATILQIFKEEATIDLDSEDISKESLEDMNFFFDQDVAKVNTIALRINKAQQQLDEFTTKIQSKKAEDQKALDRIFGERGGSADGYNEIIKKVKTLLSKVNSLNN
jgi:hypothetical protein